MLYRFIFPAFTRGIVAFGIVVSMSSTVFAQTKKPVIYPDDPIEFKRQFIEPTYFPEHITKKPGHYTVTDWDEVIDATWGLGGTITQKLAIFDAFWDAVDEDFACFPSLPGYDREFWNSLRTRYRTEIETGDPDYGVSKGRFTAMMNYLALALRESHTFTANLDVNNYTSLEPGVPLFVIGGWGVNDHFGAGLTPLPDGSLLVYKAVSPHPLGLVPGDIVLGYDNIPWADLYPQLMEAELPLFERWYWGGSESSYYHSLLMGAGMNWHLFDTIDIVRYSSGETVHLPTNLLYLQQMEIFCTEQLDIPGVPMPDYLYAGERASFGIIEGTQIGYIYIIGWSGNVEEELYNAVSTLMNDYETTGLIIDSRTNYGGLMHLGQKSYELLFNTIEPCYGWIERCDINDHLSLCPRQEQYFTHIVGAANSYYDKPIAYLVGPGSVSSGDFSSLAMKAHPMVRFFGKPTASAFNGPRWTDMVYNNYWWGRYAEAESYLKIEPEQHLTRIEFPVDEEVWLTQDDVAEGNDTVVDAAIDWINSQAGNLPDISIEPASFDIVLRRGEAVTQDLTITNSGTSHLFYSLTPAHSERFINYRENTTSAGMRTPSRKSKSVKGEYATVSNLLKRPFLDETTLTLTSYEIGSGQESTEPKSAPQILGHGGYDNFGYTWIDSHQPHGPSFEWIDISSIGTRLELGDNSYSSSIEIGFDFPFYENSYSELYICSNGYLRFGSGSTSYQNTTIPNPNQPNNIIAPWWDNLDPSLGGDIYYYQDDINSRFTVSFINIQISPYSTSGYATFQVVLYSDGRIVFNYLDMYLDVLSTPVDFYTTTVGIENSDGTDGLEIFHDAGYIFEDYSIQITTDWLAVTPSSHYIAPGENEVATVTLNAKHLLPGNYTGNIYLESDDPDEPSITIPVSLTVTACGDYDIGDFNGDNSFNIADIVEGFSKLKTGSPTAADPCECPAGSGVVWAVAMDVDNSCAFDIADIVDGFSKLKTGSPQLTPCQDCAPQGWEPVPRGGKEQFRSTIPVSISKNPGLN